MDKVRMDFVGGRFILPVKYRNSPNISAPIMERPQVTTVEVCSMSFAKTPEKANKTMDMCAFTRPVFLFTERRKENLLNKVLIVFNYLLCVGERKEKYKGFTSHIKTPSTGFRPGGISVSPSICLRSISMVRHMAVIGTSLMKFSNGSSLVSPTTSIV